MTTPIPPKVPDSFIGTSYYVLINEEGNIEKKTMTIIERIFRDIGSLFSSKIESADKYCAQLASKVGKNLKKTLLESDIPYVDKTDNSKNNHFLPLEIKSYILSCTLALDPTNIKTTKVWEIGLDQKNSITQLLLHAIEKDDVHQVEFLLNQGIDINISEGGDTLLMKSIALGSKEVAKFLLSQDNIDVNKPNPKIGTTPLMLVMFSFTPEEKCELIQLLLQKGVNINAKDKNGHTALMRAIMTTSDMTSVVRALLKFTPKQIDLEARDNNNYTVLMQAAGAKWIKNETKEKIIELLIDAGASKESFINVHQKEQRAIDLFPSELQDSSKEADKIRSLLS